MNTSYQQLFHVKILHSYFEGNVCTCLQFVPAAGTLDIMKRFQFTINENVSGFAFYSSSTVSLSDSLSHVQAVTGQSYFEFDLINNETAFYGFTALPINWTGKLLYDSAAVTAPAEGNTWLLTETLSAPATTAIAGSLKIRFDDLIKYSNDQQPLNYEISFTARATQWQYYVVNRNAVQLDNAAVKGKGDIVFENAGNVIMETGEAALLFSSAGQLIPLSKFPKHKFDLVNSIVIAGTTKTTKSNASKMIIKGLPTPDPLRMGTVVLNEKTQVSSPIYIYV